MKARTLPLFYGSRMFMQILENDNFMAACFFALHHINVLLVSSNQGGLDCWGM
jgi:hypothetical protein